MKHLIVYCHPNPDSFNNAIVETFIASLKEQGNEVVVRDLYAMRFDPVLKASDFEALREGNTPADIKAEQEHVKWADAFTMVYPIWWTGLPALIKGYIDRVFSYGFAYEYENDGTISKLLAGKKGLIINTHGTPAEIYSKTGMYDGLKITSDIGIYEFCGISPVGHIFFGSVPQIDDAARKKMLEEVRGKAVSLFE
jgi:NAD(P)H dehydrogenase (quinone)